MARLISSPLTTVKFYELAGSPEEKFTTEGFSATRRFYVKWDEREAFEKDVMGNASLFDYRSSTYYPNRTNVYPTRITFVPANATSVVRKTCEKLHTDLNSYAGWALATVEYETLSDTDLTFGPDTESGTKLTYRLAWESVENAISPEGWAWADSGAALPTDRDILQRTPEALHVLIWSQVLNPPWVTIQETQGKINVSTFLDCPAGTLLFEGAQANKLYRTTFEAGESPYCWAITYTFRQRAVHHNAQTYGWNYIYRPSDGTWALAKNQGHPMYDSADFNPLFVSE